MFRLSTAHAAGVALIAGCLGCAHGSGNHAYAPPYAPPVYPQPHTTTQPVAYAAPPGAVVAGTVPAGAVVAPGTVVSPGAVVGAGTVVEGAPCPPGTVVGGTVVGDATAVTGAVQTPPCPPGSTPVR